MQKYNIKNCWSSKFSFTSPIGTEWYDIRPTKVVLLENVTYFDTESVFSIKVYLETSRTSRMELFLKKTVNGI